MREEGRELQEKEKETTKLCDDAVELWPDADLVNDLEQNLLQRSDYSCDIILSFRISSTHFYLILSYCNADFLDFQDTM